MMKFLLFFSLSIIIIAGCQSENSKEKEKSLRSELDTFYLGKYLVSVSQIDSIIFYKINRSPGILSEEKCLMNDSSLVKRNKDTLFFRIHDKEVKLVNDTSDGDQYVKYSYEGLSKQTGQYVVSGAYYEWTSYSLIDKLTGDTTDAASSPVISPDKNMFACYFSDLESGENFNGLELFSNTHKPILIARRGLNNWAPEEIKWFNNSTLLVKATVPIDSSYTRFGTKYFKLQLK